MSNMLLTAVFGTLVAVGASVALAGEEKFLENDPVTSEELSSETGERLGGEIEGSGDEPLRRRNAKAEGGIAIDGIQNVVNVNSRQTGQANNTSLRAINDTVDIRNLAGSAGGS